MFNYSCKPNRLYILFTLVKLSKQKSKTFNLLLGYISKQLEPLAFFIGISSFLLASQKQIVISFRLEKMTQKYPQDYIIC
jgi:hypothetical protein